MLRLRFAALFEPEIAQKLNTSAATVSRDLQAIHKSWGARSRDSFDVVGEVAESVALFGMLEASALRELIRLEAQANSVTGSKIRCLWAARAMREARLDLLAAVGIIGASLPGCQHTPEGS